jgi:hypothetical protein
MYFGPVRIIFDRSAFHGERFELLKTSALKALTLSNTVAVFLTPIFLDETLMAYGTKRSVDWQQHLSFALDICNGGIFLDKFRDMASRVRHGARSFRKIPLSSRTKETIWIYITACSPLTANRRHWGSV